MPKRFDDAIYIQAGACNPTAICKALQNAIDEAREERKTTAVGDDAAVRMILHQMCHLSQMEVDDGWPRGWEAARPHPTKDDPYKGFFYWREHATCAVLAGPTTFELCNPNRRFADEWAAIDRTGPTPANAEAVKAARIAWDAEQNRRID